MFWTSWERPQTVRRLFPTRRTLRQRVRDSTDQRVVPLRVGEFTDLESCFQSFFFFSSHFSPGGGDTLDLEGPFGFVWSLQVPSCGAVVLHTGSFCDWFTVDVEAPVQSPGDNEDAIPTDGNGLAAG
mmetsp:Transcript_30461/g.78732  ORF Transcript_30461/g.78732 Transcript_30461/m.78732 type:complete len:127 (+) Transcript_30461:2388-2768(+)